MAAGSCCGLLVLTIACDQEPVVEPTFPPRSVPVVELRESRPRLETRASAVVEPYRRSDLGPDVSGLLTGVAELGADLSGPQLDGRGELLLDREGRVVRQGDVVATVDDTRYREAVAAAELAIHSTHKRIASKRVELDRVLASQLENARANYAAAQASVGSTREAVTVADSDLELARTTVERDRSLIESGAIAQSVLDTSESSFRSSAASLSQARAELERSLQNERSSLASVGVAEGRLVVQASEIEALEAQLAELENDLLRAQTDLASCTLRAPFDGRVTQAYASTGAYVIPGQPVIELTLLSPVKVVLTVSPDQERQLPLGAGVPVYSTDPAAAERTSVGTVFEKTGVADSGTRTYRVALILVNEILGAGPDRRDRRASNMQAFFPVVSMPGDGEGARWVNLRSVYERDGRSYVQRLPGFGVRGLEDFATLRVPEELEITLGEGWEQVDRWTLRSLESRELERGEVLLLDATPDDLQGVHLGPPNYAFRTGDVVRVGLSAGLPERGLWVPLDAVLERAGQNFVFLVEEGRACEVAVTVVSTSGMQRRIEGEGLRSGAKLVVEGAAFLRDGEAVQALEEGGRVQR